MIDVIIPTYGRAERIPTVAANVQEVTKFPHRIVFVVEADDIDSLNVLAVLGVPFVINDRARSYAGAMNAAYHATGNDYLFAGADDLEFTPGWDRAVLAMDDWIAVVGTNDELNPYVVQGLHSTHHLVARWYLDKIGGVIDEGPGSFLHEGYGHNYTDTEFIATAKARSRFRPCLTSIVRHLHQSAGLMPRDATHEKAEASYGADSELYDARRELWWNLSR